MKLLLKQYKRVEQEIASKEVILPTEPVYYFQTGIRRAIKIVPVFTTWMQERENKDEEIYKFDITFVYGSFENKIEKISLNKGEIENIYYEVGLKRADILEFVKDWMDDYLVKRTKEQFEEDFNNVLNNITK